MVVIFPCIIFCKPVVNAHHVIQCDNWNISLHVKCNRVNTQTYKLLQKSSVAWYSIKCSVEIPPFLNVSNEERFATNQWKSIKKFLSKNFNQKPKVFIKRNPEQNIDLIEKLNKDINDPNSERITAKYNEPDEVSFLLLGTHPDRSFCHLNISSFSLHFDEAR